MPIFGQHWADYRDSIVVSVFVDWLSLSNTEANLTAITFHDPFEGSYFKEATNRYKPLMASSPTPDCLGKGRKPHILKAFIALPLVNGQSYPEVFINISSQF